MLRTLSKQLEEFLDEATQSVFEITTLQDIVATRNPKTVIEIGLDRGGSIGRWLQLPTVETLISIDYNNPAYDYYQFTPKEPVVQAVAEFCSANGIEFHFVNQDSGSEGCLRTVQHILRNRRVDFLFIDGDHRYEPAKRDFEQYVRFMEHGLVAFHDIIDMSYSKEWKIEVYRLWGELKNAYPSIEIVDPDVIPLFQSKQQEVLMGIGVLAI